MAQGTRAEQPQYGDDPWTQLKQAVANGGPHACEFNKCPRCGSIEFDVHPFAESLSCSKCGGRYPSTTRRSCAFHDAVIQKMQETVQQVRDWYPPDVFGGAEEPDADDLSKLDPKIRALIQRKCVRMARVVCGNILAEFERLLEYELDVPADPPESGDSDEEEPDGSQPGSS